MEGLEREHYAYLGSSAGRTKQKFLVYPSGSYGVSGSQQPQNTNFDQNLPIGAL